MEYFYIFFYFIYVLLFHSIFKIFIYFYILLYKHKLKQIIELAKTFWLIA